MASGRNLEILVNRKHFLFGLSDPEAVSGALIFLFLRCNKNSPSSA